METAKSKSPSMNCSNCQCPLPGDAAFCPDCGTAVRTVAPQQSVMPTIGGLHTIHPTPGGTVPRHAEVLEAGTRFADRYVIEEQIGMGGMGVVYRVKDELSGKDVALKLIHPERAASDREMERLKEEGITARDIRHKNVVAVYDVGQSQGIPFITMEYLDGRSLRAWHRAWREAGVGVPLEYAARVITQILEGLKSAHEAGVIHRDLKPENVMVIRETEYDLEVKILDFGIARAVNAGSQTSHAIGTRGYMAPEQMTSPDLAGPSADLYSVSVMFYELLVDVLPQGHWQPPSAGRSDIPRGIDQLIEKGLSNRPASRIQSADEYLKEIAGSQNSGTKNAPSIVSSLNNVFGNVVSNFAGKKASADSPIQPTIVNAASVNPIDVFQQPAKLAANTNAPPNVPPVDVYAKQTNQENQPAANDPHAAEPFSAEVVDPAPGRNAHQPPPNPHDNYARGNYAHDAYGKDAFANQGNLKPAASTGWSTTTVVTISVIAIIAAVLGICGLGLLVEMANSSGYDPNNEMYYEQNDVGNDSWADESFADEGYYDPKAASNEFGSEWGK